MEAGSPDATTPTDGGPLLGAHLPLVKIADVPVPGGMTRFDYQDIDSATGRLVIAHMNDNSVLVVRLSDGVPYTVLPNVNVARGIAVADNIGRFFATSMPSTLVIYDNMTLKEVGRVGTGNGPDGVGWDPVHMVVGTSDQSDGALSLIPNAGSGTRMQVKLGTSTGNAVFDATRGWFWITVVGGAPQDRLLAIDPMTGAVTTTISLPGCSGAHGFRLHPDAKSAFVACETNYVMARVDLVGGTVVGTAPTGVGPDVLSIDPAIGWVYVAAESGDLTVFDMNKPGAVLIGHDQPGANSHTVIVDPPTHRVFFPLQSGPSGPPVLRIMKPSGI
jgi:DNA-binding beta-propeller fold protein YncE